MRVEERRLRCSRVRTTVNVCVCVCVCVSWEEPLASYVIIVACRYLSPLFSLSLSLSLNVISLVLRRPSFPA